MLCPSVNEVKLCFMEIHHSPPEDDGERLSRELGEAFVAKFKKARLSEIISSVLTVALVIIGISQAVVAWDSYHDTSPLVGFAKDTRDAAQSFSGSAAMNAKAAQDFATYANNINTGVQNAVSKLQLQADQTSRNADAATSAAETASDQLELSERPWVSSLPALATGLYRNVNGLNMSLKITHSNTGRTPAIKVSVYAKFFPLVGPEQMDQIKKSVCDQAVKTAYFSEESVVPGVPVDQTVDIRMSPEFLARYTQNGFVFVQLVLCSAYKSDLKQSRQYTSTEVFSLDGKDAEGKSELIDPTKDTPVGRLQLRNTFAHVTLVD
jgi:hypothetical protein